jgi:putative transcriptional regulator
MQSSLKAELARLGPLRAIPGVQSGSSARFSLTLERKDWPELNSIAATMVLARRGMAMLAAKGVIETLIDETRNQERGCAVVLLPRTESAEAVIAELGMAGIRALHDDHEADRQERIGHGPETR